MATTKISFEQFMGRSIRESSMDTELGALRPKLEKIASKYFANVPLSYDITGSVSTAHYKIESEDKERTGKIYFVISITLDQDGKYSTRKNSAPNTIYTPSEGSGVYDSHKLPLRALKSSEESKLLSYIETETKKASIKYNELIGK